MSETGSISGVECQGFCERGKGFFIIFLCFIGFANAPVSFGTGRVKMDRLLEVFDGPGIIVVYQFRLPDFQQFLDCRLPGGISGRGERGCGRGRW